MQSNKKISVILEDAETGKQYTIHVSKDEAQRINTDVNFANFKLQEAIAGRYDPDEIENDGQENMETLDENIGLDGYDRSTSACAENGVFKWPHDAILLLIEEYRSQEDNFKSGKTSQKKVWAAIAEKMNKYGHNVTGPQCLSKWTGLKRTYKGIKDHKSRSGNDRRTWPYFTILDEALGSKPFMSPVTTLSSSTKRTRSPSECSNSSFDSFADGDEMAKPKKMRQTSGVEDLLKDVIESRNKAEEAAERRHQENIAVREKCHQETTMLRDRFITAFEKIVDILQKK